MQTKDIQPLLKLFFGTCADLCWDQIASIKAATANMTYSFMSKAEHDALVQRQPLEAMAVYWNEMIQRAHLGSCSALLRHEQWLNGMASQQSMNGILDSSHASEDFWNRQRIRLIPVVPLHTFSQIISRRSAPTCKSGLLASFLDHTNWRNA
jgi:hypothetical protein